MFDLDRNFNRLWVLDFCAKLLVKHSHSVSSWWNSGDLELALFIRYGVKGMRINSQEGAHPAVPITLDEIKARPGEHGLLRVSFTTHAVRAEPANARIIS